MLSRSIDVSRWMGKPMYGVQGISGKSAFELCYHYFGHDEQHLCVNPTIEDVARAIEVIDWNHIAHLDLRIDKRNYISVVGSTAVGESIGIFLFVDGIFYSAENKLPAPSAALDYFKLYLQQKEDALFELIFDAKGRGLSAKEIANLRQQQVLHFRKIKKRDAMMEANTLFSEKRYAEFVATAEPFEELLEGIELKKLALARKKLG